MSDSPHDTSPHDTYRNPLTTRYASEAMRRLWSEQRKFSTWRRLWLELARAQQRLGLDVADGQLEQMAASVDEIDFAAAAEYEKRFRHDVMAHVHAFGDAAPAARAIVHLGATSCFVTDNADLILMREGLGQVRAYLLDAVARLADFARTHADLPTLGFTHFQPAQLTTVGKRACLWLHDLLLDLAEIDHRVASLKFRGVKGTTGTQASFLALFDGDWDQVRELDRLVARAFGFAETYPVSGQTYSRKVDSQILATLSGVCQSAAKFAVDVRLLAHRKELEEPFESEQVGSSAMAYKRNPMRCERIGALSRFVQTLAANADRTQSEQWLERTLDDSANRRLSLPQAFLGADAVLSLVRNVAGGLVVHPQVVAANVRAELPFMATENVLMAQVKAGGDRQELHEVIRRHSMDAAAQVKRHGRPNDLIERLKADGHFGAVDFDAVLEPAAFVGAAPRQVAWFLEQHVWPVLADEAAPLAEVVLPV